MRVYAIDPGYSASALVVLDDWGSVLEAETCDNPVLLAKLIVVAGQLTRGLLPPSALVIEQIESMGMAVGKETFETVFWSGRFAQAWWPRDAARVPRAAVKLHLCGQRNAKDTNVRQALIDRYGPTKAQAIGRKGSPGPLYGLVGHEFAALAVGVTWIDTR